MIKNKFYFFSIVIIAVINFQYSIFAQVITASTISPNSLVGNIYGTVIDSATGQGIQGAEIYLFENKMMKSSSGNIVHTAQGSFLLPDFSLAVKSGTTNKNGGFLLNFVPAPFPFKYYTIIIKTEGHNLLIIDQARVLPGAAMAFQINCALSKNTSDVLYYEGTDKTGPFMYRDEALAKKSMNKISNLSRPQKVNDVNYNIYATREGLVGGTCANGHIIVTNDHFVALPSFLVLNKNDKTYDFQVRISYGKKTVIAPVWDVGPWNVKDDYWNPDSLRQIYSTLHHGGQAGLGEGVPESQAAYYYNYNQDWSGDFTGSGKDYYQVKLPAAIDLADGTFLQDLGLPDNTWIKVDYLWRPGVIMRDTIIVSNTVPVMTTPGGTTSLGQEQTGNKGTIIDGPKSGYYSSTYYVWWKIQWNDGLTGWSFEKNLQRSDSRNVNVTFLTDPPDLNITVDGLVYVTPYTFSWEGDSVHSISAASQATGNTRFTWKSWSDLGQNPHNIYPYNDKIFTASFVPQYELQLSSNPTNGGYFSSSTVTWQNPNTTVSIFPVPNNGYVFNSWSGDTVSTSNPLILKMYKPFSLIGNFSPATGINDNQTNDPASHSVSQNYPNPFNPSTLITYSIPKGGRVTLKVFDVLGREVKTLVNEYKNAGTYKVEFNGANITSGVYFYNIQSGGYSAAKKFVLLK